MSLLFGCSCNRLAHAQVEIDFVQCDVTKLELKGEKNLISIQPKGNIFT